MPEEQSPSNHGYSDVNHFLGTEWRTDEDTGCTKCVLYCTCGMEWTE